MTSKFSNLFKISLSAGGIALTTFVTVKAKSLIDNKNKNNDNILIKTVNLEDSNNNSNNNKTNAISTCCKKLAQWKQVNNIPGIIVGVSKKGQTIWLYSNGYADIENNVLCNEDTVMRIASISKSITALLLAQFVQDKKLDLNVPISKYLSQDKFPTKYWNNKKVDITLKQLASHTGGIRHYKKDDKDQNKNNSSEEFQLKEYYLKDNFPTVVESLKLFKDDPLVAEPGTKYVYTTFGYTLLSAVIESVLDEKDDFGKHLEKFLHEQLGMNNTCLDKHSPIIYDRSSYYMKLGGKIINAPYVDNSYKWAGGGLLSNIPDLLKFGNIMLYCYKDSPDGNKGILNKDIIEEMWTPVQVQDKPLKDWGGYGIGWVMMKDAQSKFAFCSEPPFENAFFHTGAAIGASSVLLIEPEKEIVVAILANLQEAGNISKIGIEIAKEFSKL